MDTPQKNEQVTSDAPVDTSALLADTFDQMDSDTSNGETEHETNTEITDIQEQAGEVQSEATETVIEEEGTQEAQSPEAEEITEEIKEAEESGYKEPAPERWPEELKTHYNALSPEGKQLLMENVYKPMQRQYTQSTQELSAMRKTVEPMIKSLEQYRNDFDRMGVNPQEAFQTQVAWAAHFARVGPQKGLDDMRDAYGLGSGETGNQTAEQYLTPTERAMKTQIDGLQQQVDKTSQSSNDFQEQQRQTAQSNHINGIRNDLTSFINEQKDGKPAHPHVEKVAPAIAGIIRGGLIKNTDEYGQHVPIKTQMAQAYTMACRLDPSIRTAATNTRQVNLASNAQKADVVAKTPGGQTDVPKLSMQEQLEETYDNLGIGKR